MNNYFSIFKQYVNSYEQKKNKYNINFLILGEKVRLDELLFLYRQARIYNIESELSLTLDSEKYKEKREGIIKFFSKLGLKNADDSRVPFFAYNQSKDCFDSMPFIAFYSFYCLNSKEATFEFIEEAIKLFDVDGIVHFCLAYVEHAKAKNKPVPAFISFVLERENKHQLKPETELVPYAIANKEQEIDIKQHNVLCKKYLNALYISGNLTPKSKSFLVLAEDLHYNISNSTFADFSVVSLQYYKVIETEIKEKIIKESTKDIKWGKFYVGKKYYKMSDFDYSVLTLGEIYNIFKDAADYINGDYSAPSDSINTKIFDNIYNKCRKDIEYLLFFRDITSSIFRDWFRNPPAHTEPLAEEYIPMVENIYFYFISNIATLTTKNKFKVERGKLIDYICELSGS